MPVENPKQTTFERAGEVIERAREFHREVSERYAELADEAGRERVRMLLEYLSRHEQSLERTLADYEERAPGEVLDTWLQYVPEAETLERLEPLSRPTLGPDTDVGEIVNLGLEVADALIALYRDVARKAPSDEVREAFGNLVEMEQEEKRKLARNVADAEDV